MKSTKSNYHKTVADYYDEDAELGFEDRAAGNVILDRIRGDFRKIASQYVGSQVLEIGCGPGFDLEWFATNYPDSSIIALDISEKMTAAAQRRIDQNGFQHAQVFTADEVSMMDILPESSFDLIYVFFGALNTVEDLNLAAANISKLLKPGGHAVLTFVNKWYLREMLVQLVKLRFRSAFARIRKVWGGYSVNRHLPSSCYSPGQVERAYKDLKLIFRKGYSIFYPAWYNQHKLKGRTDGGDSLWKRDAQVQNTWLWSKGEYTLFVFHKPT